MVDSALAYGLEPLVEVHSREEAKAVLSTDTRLAGINNRDLRTMRTNLTTTMRLAPDLRMAGLTVVSESGLIWPCDIRTLRPFADAFLIGTAIMDSRDPGQRLGGFVSA
jgi:indole-3-glycerol phosphate synthase